MSFVPTGRKFNHSLTVVALILAGCAAADRPIVPPVNVGDGFTATAGLPLPDQWWRSFDDPVLDRLIDEALAENFDLKTAWDRLRQARATALIEAAALIPSLDGTGGTARAYRQEESLRGGFDDSGGGTNFTTEDNFALGLQVSYELDLWGRVRSTRDAAIFDVEASAEDLHAAALTLSASVADTWYQLVEQNAQVDLLKAQLALNENVTKLVETRFRQGQVGSLDVFQQRQLEESRRGDLALARGRAAVFAHQLAILLGHPPTKTVAPRIAKLLFPGKLPATGLPAALVQRRPDVRSAYYDVLAADRRVWAAIADRFPRISLTADLNTDAEAIRDLFDNYLATLAANFVAPLIDGGARANEVARVRAILSERLNSYGQTILGAFGEVEDALTNEARQREHLTSLERQLELASAALRRVRQGYLNGTNDYLRVLDAISSEQELQRTDLTARRTLLQQRINLCRALGGSWELDAPPLARLVVESPTPDRAP
jgi:NodT family efflux transporter outer membrane factor (OMF) lipoprotein